MDFSEIESFHIAYNGFILHWPVALIISLDLLVVYDIKPSQ